MQSTEKDRHFSIRNSIYDLSKVRIGVIHIPRGQIFWYFLPNFWQIDISHFLVKMEILKTLVWATWLLGRISKYISFVYTPVVFYLHSPNIGLGVSPFLKLPPPPSLDAPLKGASNIVPSVGGANQEVFLGEFLAALNGLKSSSSRLKGFCIMLKKHNTQHGVKF